MSSTKTYLIDMQGRVVRAWESDCTPALGAYLLQNGHLLRTGKLSQQAFGDGPGGGPGAGGRIQEFTWEGKLVWDFKFASDKQLPHHDICKLPNGNVLLVAWEKKTAKQVVAAGRRPELAGDGDLMPDCIIEIKPTGKTTGEVVWEWHIWDHLIQDQDPSRPNHGNVAAHPELIDINYGENLIASMVEKKDGLDKLRSLGYIGSPSPGKKPQSIHADWTHINSVAYNAKLDQVMLSVHAFSEIWIIDHSTTTAQAARHSGGRYGKGGDLLYRWGNPQAYHAGKAEDQQLFHQHDAHWIPPGLPGEGHVLVFNNGTVRSNNSSYSSVDEIVLPVDPGGQYTLKPGNAYGPVKPVWSYTAPDKAEFFAMLMSGAHRLPNGNTLICSSTRGIIFEVTAEKEIVWLYTNPIGGNGPEAVLVLDNARGRTEDGYAPIGNGILAVDRMVNESLLLCSVLDLPGGFDRPLARGAEVAPASPKQGGAASLFRAYRYAPSFPGLVGKNLTPGKTVEELLQEETTKK